MWTSSIKLNGGALSCDVRAASSGAKRTLVFKPSSIRSARWTRAGTPQRDVPTTDLCPTHLITPDLDCAMDSLEPLAIVRQSP
jgi:hypothetical protein